MSGDERSIREQAIETAARRLYDLYEPSDDQAHVLAGCAVDALAAAGLLREHASRLPLDRDRYIAELHAVVEPDWEWPRPAPTNTTNWADPWLNLLERVRELREHASREHEDAS